MKEEYVKIEIKNNGKISITKTTDLTWVDRYYCGSNILLATVCLKSKIIKNLAKLKKRALKELIKEREKVEKIIFNIDEIFLLVIN